MKDTQNCAYQTLKQSSLRASRLAEYEHGHPPGSQWYYTNIEDIFILQQPRNIKMAEPWGSRKKEQWKTVRICCICPSRNTISISNLIFPDISVGPCFKNIYIQGTNAEHIQIFGPGLENVTMGFFIFSWSWDILHSFRKMLSTIFKKNISTRSLSCWVCSKGIRFEASIRV